MPLSQDYRSVSVVSPLGKDVLLFLSINGEESMGRLYGFELDVLSTQHSINSNALLGQLLTVTFKMSNGKPRYFSGYATSLRMLADVGELARYRLVLQPGLWFLTRRTNCRIFQNKTAPDIVKAVLREYGFITLKEKLSDTYPKREFCVQYRESDFDFVSRLMEEDGFYYFFEQAQDHHVLHLVDSEAAHSAKSGYEKLPFFPPANMAQRERDHIFGWCSAHAVHSGVYTLNDFDFEKPKASLVAKLSSPKGHDNAKYEQYDYPGRYVAQDDGASYAKKRLQAVQGECETFSGEGNAFGLAVGSTFTLAGHPLSNLNAEYLLTGLSFSIETNAYQSGVGEAHQFGHRLALTAISSKSPFRAAHSTPRPVVRGPQTAIVVGPSGDEIHTDKHGRVKVQFHWDREGKSDENSSCWVRVSQAWAGQGWGGISIPRIGQEVVVDFLEGDPDRPIIIGRVYNGDQTVPYGLPANATQTGIKSRSSKGAGADNFNEIRLEDKKDHEEIYVHAEKDMNVVVENSETRKVGFDKKNPGNQKVEIYNDRSATLEQGNDALTVKQGSQTQDIFKNRTVTLTTGNDAVNLKQGNQSVQLDMGNCSVHLKMGNQETKLDLGSSSTEAMQSIELKVGQSSVKIDQMGVTIKGMSVKIEGTLQAEVKAVKTDIKADAMLTAKGAITMIN